MSSLYGYLEGLQAVLRTLPLATLREIVDTLHEAYRADHTVFVVGNGGSASTASHVACDLAKLTSHSGRRRLRSIALTDSLPLLTAWANDAGYEHVFAEQLHNLGRPGDVLLAISGSGNSPNVLCAVAHAREHGLTSIGLTGFSGGRLRDLVDICLIVPSDCMQHVEDTHLILGHLIASHLREVIGRDGDLSGSGWGDQREPARPRETLGRVPVPAGGA